MPVSQITFTDQDKVLNFEQMLARFAGGWVYIGEGSYADALNGIAFDDDKQIVNLWVEKHYSDQPRIEVRVKGNLKS
jgi:hypothetical protein